MRPDPIASKKTSPNGFTLVELLVAVFILAFSITGILQIFVKSMISSNMAWDLTVATSHADLIMEEMKQRKTLAEITSTDWKTWVDQRQLMSLPDENIDIAFVNLEGDPLGIEVTVHWNKQERAQKVHFETLITK